jgi:hypothetical protein
MLGGLSPSRGREAPCTPKSEANTRPIRASTPADLGGRAAGGRRRLSDIRTNQPMDRPVWKAQCTEKVSRPPGWTVVPDTLLHPDTDVFGHRRDGRRHGPCDCRIEGSATRQDELRATIAALTANTSPCESKSRRTRGTGAADAVALATDVWHRGFLLERTLVHALTEYGITSTGRVDAGGLEMGGGGVRCGPPARGREARLPKATQPCGRCRRAATRTLLRVPVRTYLARPLRTNPLFIASTTRSASSKRQHSDV